MRIIVIPTFIATAAILWDVAVNDYVSQSFVFAALFGLLGLVAIGLLIVATAP